MTFYCYLEKPFFASVILLRFKLISSFNIWSNRIKPLKKKLNCEYNIRYIIIVLSKNVPILELNVIKLENVYELEMWCGARSTHRRIF
jgi:hypothetical protein